MTRILQQTRYVREGAAGKSDRDSSNKIPLDEVEKYKIIRTDKDTLTAT
ncbi:MAG: hypothetical protein QXT26_06200 [Thermoproteota archaeon]